MLLTGSLLLPLRRVRRRISIIGLIFQRLISLQALHLPCLELAEILLAQVDPAYLVAHEIHCDVLLRLLLVGLRLLQRLLPDRLVRLGHSSDMAGAIVSYFSSQMVQCLYKQHKTHKSILGPISSTSTRGSF